MTRITLFVRSSFAALLLVAAAGCAELSDPYYGSGGSPYGGGYNTGGYGGYNSGYNSGYRAPYRDPYYERERERDYYEHRRLERERERLREERERAEEERERAERERRRLERERHHMGGSMYRPPAPPPPAAAPAEHCPSGYDETNRKCTDAERKRGCSDIKMPSGRRCIRL